MTDRTIDQIKEEFNRVMTKAANTQYQLYLLKKDLDMFNQELSDLNLEAAALPKDESNA